MNENGDLRPFDSSDFTLRRRGRSYQEFAVGQRFAHHWGRTLEKSDNIAFCTATCNWNPLFLNQEFARAQGHHECPINPALVACVVTGLTVEDLSEIAGPLLTVSECVFARPVYPGDTLTAQSEVTSCRPSKSRPDAGVVSWRTEGSNQRGEVVVTMLRSNLVSLCAGPPGCP